MRVKKLPPVIRDESDDGSIRKLSFSASLCTLRLSSMSDFDSPRPAMDRKIFFLDLKENHRGRVLKITEDVGGRRNTIMLPAEAFGDFVGALERLVEFEEKL
jgi:hypothetical protein